MTTLIETQADFTRIFEEYNEAVYKFIYLRSGRQQALAEDLTQEIFLKIWNKRETFTANSSVKSWIFKIAKNTLIDHYRKKKPDLSIDEELIESVATVQSNEDTDVMHDFVMTKLDLLSESDRELLIHRYIDELEIQEIADLTERSYQNTKVAIHRALNRLKKIIDGTES